MKPTRTMKTNKKIKTTSKFKRGQGYGCLFGRKIGQILLDVDKSSIFVVQKALTPKSEVEFGQKSTGRVRCNQANRHASVNIFRLASIHPFMPVGDRCVRLGERLGKLYWTQINRQFLARATVGTSLYVLLCQLVSPLVSQLIGAFLFFKTQIRVLIDNVGT